MSRYKKNISLQDKLYIKYMNLRKSYTKRGIGLKESIDKKTFQFRVRIGVLTEDDFKELIQSETIADLESANLIADRLISANKFPSHFNITYNKDGTVNKPNIRKQLRAMNGMQYNAFFSWAIDEDIFEDSDEIEDLLY